jgi:acetyl esterase/lipase
MFSHQREGVEVVVLTDFPAIPNAAIHRNSHEYSSMKALLHLLLLLATAGMVAATEIPELIPLWPGAAPGSEKLTLTEKITERSTDPARPDRIYTQIATPSLLVHRPENPNGIAVIVAPGGGYSRIVIDKEGPDTSAWLNRLGVTSFVLKYRLPGEGHEHGEDVALQDAQRAVRVIRAHAAEWGLDPARVGFIGYSAGGHLAASLEFFSGRSIYAAVDDADKLSARPDFSVLGYAPSGGQGTRPASLDGLSPQARMMWEYKIEAAPGVKYPPAFILQADDDPTVNPQNAAKIYLALKQNGTPVEMHVFRSGGHGFGIRDAKGPVSHWPDLCADWLRGIGILR